MKKKPKLKSISSLMKKASKVFKKYIRTHDFDKNGVISCITCGSTNSIQAGHFIHGITKQTGLMEENVHPQCKRCNLFLSGNLIPYYEYMLER